MKFKGNEHIKKGWGKRYRNLAGLLCTMLLCAAAGTADACTAAYVGREASSDGVPVIARCADTNPPTTSVYLRITPEGHSRTVTGKNGFSWKLPENTYKFVSVPRSPALEKGHEWDSAAINDQGLAVSGTVTAYLCEEALKADPYVADGISEDNIAGILAASCPTARSAVLYLAHIIDEKGSAESNVVMMLDQKEAWYMEIYGGHQYAAVKMPADAVAVLGNEFMLESLEPFGGDVICSKDLIALPEREGFLRRNAKGEPELFATYSGEGRLADYANMRTWRGHQLLSPATAGKYETHRKYPLFFRPDSKVTTDALMALFRDRMEGVVSEEELALGKTRIIGTETASQVHLLRVHPELPSFMAVEEWLCFSNAAYAPFLPISNALTTAAAPYTYVLPNYALDTNSAAHVYKKLNALAAQDRKRLGLNVERYWENQETKWQADWQKAMGEAKKLAESGDKAGAAALLTACSLGTQTSALEDAGRIYDELLWHLMETTNTMTYGFSYDTLQVGEKKESVFMPLVDAAAYAAQRNWRQEQAAKGLRLSREGQSMEILPSDGKRTSKGVLKQGGKERGIAAVAKEGKIYIPLDEAERGFR